MNAWLVAQIAPGTRAYKWAWEYKRWTWPLAGLIALLLLSILIMGIKGVVAIFGGGGAMFKIALLVGVVGIYAYQGVRKRMPPTWAMATVIGAPLFLWGFWTIRPVWYMEWRTSRYFIWMILTAVALGWLANYRVDPVARAARAGLLGLMVLAVLIGAFSKRKEVLDDVKMSLGLTDTIPPPTLPSTPVRTPWPADTTIVVLADTIWSHPILMPEEAIGGRVTWEITDPDGNESDCYEVWVTRGKFRFCPGEPFVNLAADDAPGQNLGAGFVRVRMLHPQSRLREIAIRIRV